MNIFGKNLYKKICILLTLVCCVVFDKACADQKIDMYFDDSEKPSETPLVKTLCPQGYYLSRCGLGVSLGTNWLKGMEKTKTGTQTIRTPDYYSYEVPVSDTIHITNLRKFFAGTEPFTYITQEGTEQTVLPTVYKTHKNIILSHICTDDSGVLVGIECEKCPGDANVYASTVKQNPTTNKLLWKSWDVHTVADCYTKEFSDNTGTYKYVATNVQADTNSAPQTCYYSTNVPGDTLR